MKKLSNPKPNKIKNYFLVSILTLLLLNTIPLFSLNITFDNGIALYKNKSFKEAYAVFFQLQEKENKSSYYFYLGNISHFLGKDDDAENWYKKGVLISKNFSSEYYFNYGVILINNQKPSEAIQVLENIEIKNAMVRTILSILYYNDKNYLKAESHLKSLMEEVKEMPDDFLVPIYENYFFTSLQLKNYYQAVNIGNLLRNFKESSPDFWINYAGVLYQTSQISKAIDVYKTLAEKEESLKEQSYFKMLYLLAFKRKNYDEAFKYIESALKKYSTQHNFYKIKAYLYYLTENWQQAWEILEKTVPSSKQDYKNKAFIAYQNNKEKEAIQTLENAYIIYPDDDILNNLVSLYLKSNKLQQAELSIRLYQDKKKTDQLYLWLFQIAIMKEDLKKAQEYGEKFLASNYEKPFHFYYNLGKVYEKNSDLPKAIDLYEKSKRIAPDFPYPYVALANIYVSQKKFKEAEDNYLITIKLLPDFGVYFYQLAQVYALSENYFLAKELLKQALYRQFLKDIILSDPLFDPVFKNFPDFKKEFQEF